MREGAGAALGAGSACQDAHLGQARMWGSPPCTPRGHASAGWGQGVEPDPLYLEAEVADNQPGLPGSGSRLLRSWGSCGGSLGGTCSGESGYLGTARPGDRRKAAAGP